LNFQAPGLFFQGLEKPAAAFPGFGIGTPSIFKTWKNHALSTAFIHQSAQTVLFCRFSIALILITALP